MNRLNLTQILEKGYFPKELPPAFNTMKFGRKSRFISKKWYDYENNLKSQIGSETNRQAKSRYKPIINKYTVSKLFEYNISKGLYSRRKIEIPHPLTYFLLCNEIVKNKKIFKETYSLSRFSESTLSSGNINKRSVKTKSKNWSDFKNKLTEISFNYKVQLKIDITNYYHSIYTHSIPWSILGKDLSKDYFTIKSADINRFNNLVSTDNDARKYQIADNIDTLVRNCNDKQSVGIPIGPDSSFILSELLGSRLDNEIFNNIANYDYKCVRYYDDFYIYTNSLGDAESILKKVQKIFSEYKLEINESKINIKQLPYFHSDFWNIEIHNYQFKNKRIDSTQELTYYFSLVFKLVEENKDMTSWIIAYSLTKFEYGNVLVNKKDIDIFISLLLQTLYLDSSNIDTIFKIIYSYEEYLNTKILKKIKELLDKFIPEHLNLNHSMEVAWGLWFFKSLNINPEINLIQEILDSEDQVSILIAIDIIISKNINQNQFDFTVLQSKLLSDNLYSKFWLICYETELKNLLNLNPNLIIDHEFFKILKHYQVDFYNSELQVSKKFSINSTEANFDFSEFPNMFGIDSENNFYDQPF